MQNFNSNLSLNVASSDCFDDEDNVKGGGARLSLITSQPLPFIDQSAVFLSLLQTFTVSFFYILYRNLYEFYDAHFVPAKKKCQQTTEYRQFYFIKKLVFVTHTHHTTHNTNITYMRHFLWCRLFTAEFA